MWIFNSTEGRMESRDKEQTNTFENAGSHPTKTV